MMQSTGIGKTPAPYGQACLPCVKAKSRCMIRDDNTCERCHRLDKECIPSSTVRKRSAKRSTASKRAQLEDKLDDLVTLLRTQQAKSPNDRNAEQQTITPRSLDCSPQQTEFEPSLYDTLTEQELAKFRQLHLPYFPFIHLPLTLTSDQLQHEKPLLAFAMKTTCNKSHSQQSKMSKMMRGAIAQRLMVDGEKSIDLLLALLTCMAWSIYFTSGKKFLVMFSGIARSLVSDLHIDKPKFPSWCPSTGPLVEQGITQTNESRRALLACYALTAMVSMTFKSDMMPWTSQIDENCLKLAADAETEGDEILIAMVRISKLFMQATEIYRDLFDNASPHATLHIGPLKHSLDELMRTLSNTQKQHVTVTTHLYAAEVAIYELAIFQPVSPTSKVSAILDYKRIDYIMQCVQSCKICTDYYLNMDLIHITVASGLVYSYCIKTLHRLSTLQDPHWDPTVVSEIVDATELFERCAVAADLCNTKLKEETGEDSVFRIAAKMLRDTAPTWRVAVDQEPPAQACGDASLEGWNGLEGMDLPSIDFSDDFWMTAPFNV